MRRPGGWKYKVDFNKFWDSKLPISEKGWLSVHELNKIEKHFPDDYDLHDIIDQFEYSIETIDDFDYVMSELYDWADSNKVWIKTLF